MNARDLSPAAPAAAALPPSNPGLTSPLDLSGARQLRDGLRSLLGAERCAAAEFLLALADFDRRRGWEPLGHASLFAFLVAEMKLSKGGASFRLAAARLVQRFPSVIEPLRDGRLCITTAFEVAKVLTEQNLADVLPRFFGLSSAEAKEVVAALAPREAPPLRTVVTPLFEPPRLAAAIEHAASPGEGPVVPAEPDAAPRGVVQLTELKRPARVLDRRTDVEPLTADLRRLHVTVSARLLRKLDAARDGLSHAIPNASAEQVLEAALDLLLKKQAKARGHVKRPRAVRPPTISTPIDVDRGDEHRQGPGAGASLARPEGRAIRRAGPRPAIPAAVRRAVWERDGGRCSWPLDGGGTCGSTHRLELDHVVPWARGGDNTASNLRLTCAAHNRVAARQAFGDRQMLRYRGASAAQS